jgi:hypothetical protein
MLAAGIASDPYQVEASCEARACIMLTRLTIRARILILLLASAFPAAFLSRY